MSTQLSLRIHSVKCVDETGGSFAEHFGNDEIALGGMVLNATGETTKVDPFWVYGSFDDGDVFVFPQPRVFHTFPLGTSFPVEFGCGLTVIEKDAGGAADAVAKLADYVEEQVKAHLPKARDQRAMATPGSRAALAPLLSWAIGAAAPAVLSYLKNKLSALFSDDVFRPQFTTVTIGSKDFTWSGSKVSARKTLLFSDHGGKYEVVYDWALN